QSSHMVRVLLHLEGVVRLRFFSCQIPASSEIYSLSLHDALPISWKRLRGMDIGLTNPTVVLWAAVDPDGRLVIYDEFYRTGATRSEEHTSELQSRENLVCRLLLEKKKTNVEHNSTVCMHFH